MTGVEVVDPALLGGESPLPPVGTGVEVVDPALMGGESPLPPVGCQ